MMSVIITQVKIGKANDNSDEKEIEKERNGFLEVYNLLVTNPGCGTTWDKNAKWVFSSYRSGG